ncbi:hypothetical protein MLD38_012079 [Melastoma candidum]|uniref:Uncharacterized protein n=1 Tax=Melastoma candidum TaxID=119954 RepID=A0ACB9R687_9MYRT|nr:hypothetical protein MLD38_012079 [Melastoma candidum]
MTCPPNSVRYNSTLCACRPGYFANATAGGCVLFGANTTISANSGVDDYTTSFPLSFFSFDSIRRFTQSQAVFLEATAVLLLSWMVFCLFLRFKKVGDGRNVWFQIRWWISRLDVCFSTRHWLDDQRVVRKRKTELGGALSIACWILFTGLFSALLYQVITRRTIEVHNVKAANAPELVTFNNDMEFNITTISSMSCSNLLSPNSIVTGTPGFLDYRAASLSNFANFSCQNTSEGPTITFKCNNCQLTQDIFYISWQFVDLPNSPAVAVGFRFEFSASNHNRKKYVTSLGGTVRNTSIADDSPVTFRGTDPNILKFNLIPNLYHNLDDLRLIQPLFHEFLPGSYIRDATQLQASLESSNGLINTTLYINFLSAYIVEINKQNILGPVSFLADLGGLYCISIGIFYYLMVQFEYRVKKLRNEDLVLRRVRSRMKAQAHWDKLRKYVMYTWGCPKMDDSFNWTKNDTEFGGCMMHTRRTGSHSAGGSLRKKPIRKDLISLSQKLSVPSLENTTAPFVQMQGVKNHAACPVTNLQSRGQLHPSTCSDHISSPVHPSSFTDNILIPPPPSLELKSSSDMTMADVQKSLMRLYNYNVLLREKLVSMQSSIHQVAKDSLSSLHQD